MSITEYFSRDHDRLDELFRQFKLYKTENPSLAKEYFLNFYEGLQRHIRLEEDILFPILESKLKMSGEGPTRVMRIEHEAIKNILERLREDWSNGQSLHCENEDLLTAVLLPHNEKEEQGRGG